MCQISRTFDVVPYCIGKGFPYISCLLLRGLHEELNPFGRGPKMALNCKHQTQSCPLKAFYVPRTAYCYLWLWSVKIRTMSAGFEIASGHFSWHKKVQWTTNIAILLAEIFLGFFGTLKHIFKIHQISLQGQHTLIPAMVHTWHFCIFKFIHQKLVTYTNFAEWVSLNSSKTTPFSYDIWLRRYLQKIIPENQWTNCSNILLVF